MVTTLRKLHGPIPQSEPLDARQSPNDAGGYSYTVDDFQRLHRFLILGSEGGTYYVNERKHSQQNVECLSRCLKEDYARAITLIVDISINGRAAKNDYAIYALALAASCDIPEARQMALAQVNHVCRTGTHLFMFTEFCNEMRGWGRGLRNAIANWYTSKTPEQLAYQAVKYQQRGGWSHADLLRLSHPQKDELNTLFKYIVDGWDGHDVPSLIAGVEAIKQDISIRAAAAFIRHDRIPREAVPTELLTKPEVWDALLNGGDMPMTAMIRNLATMTRVGLLAPLSDASMTICKQLTDPVRIKKARVHPIQILAALVTYAQGHGMRGHGTWTPVQPVMDALDAAFSLSFGNVVPINKPVILALDISGSMFGSQIGGVPGLDAAMGAAAMALITAATEPTYAIMAYTTQPVIVDGITGTTHLRDIYNYMEQLSRQMGGTDCAQPFLWAKGHGITADFVVSYTDSQTWAGRIHPQAAFDDYRRTVNPNCRAAVVAMTATDYTLFHPDDAGAVNVVGFDTATPNILSAFARGEV
jgi:60 kDa SS-A/Ro ribonucleoprotein